MKAASTALNEGDGETCLKQRALSLPDRQGVPTAIQIADRFHVLQNRKEALDRVCIMHEKTLDAVIS